MYIPEPHEYAEDLHCRYHQWKDIDAVKAQGFADQWMMFNAALVRQNIEHMERRNK